MSAVAFSFVNAFRPSSTRSLSVFDQHIYLCSRSVRSQKMLTASLPCRNADANHHLLTILDQCKSLLELKKNHALITTLGLSRDDPFVSKLLSFTALSDWGDVDYSYRLFSQLSSPKTFYWDIIIRGYSNSKNPNPAISVFVKMLRVGVSPDYLTYPFLMKASSKLLKKELGAALHSHVVKTGFQSDRFIQNSLIHMYASCGGIRYARKVFDGMLTRNLVSWNSMLDGYSKCGDVKSAKEVFELMPERDVVSWSSLIDGHVKTGEFREAMVEFNKMNAAGSKANEVTMVSVLCACAHLGALEQGRMMHQYIVDNRLPLTLVLQTSLVDMYAKCGEVEEALAVFRGIPLSRTDVFIWNAIIGALATHGLAKESLELFREMQRVGIIPDEITYLCLLTACAHGGLVREAWHFFEGLCRHGMTPKSEHYACMVDVLARAGQLAEAYQLISQMSMEPTASMLGALLSGCMNHGKLDLAEIVGRKLIELEPDHDGRYIGLSNIYAVEKRWDDAKTIRVAMERRGVKKSPGFSFVEIFGTFHRFVALDKTHPESERIYFMLKLIISQIRQETDYEDHVYCLCNINDF